MTVLAPTLERYFTERLIAQKGASAHTVAAYADTFRLLLAFAQDRTGKAPSVLDFSDFDAPLIGAFLDHLEHSRHNSVRTRNARLAAVHSFFRFSALWHPEHAGLISRPSPYRPNAPCALTSASSSRRRSRRSWPRRTGTVGWEGGTMPYCSWPCRQGSGSRRSRGSAVGTSSSVAEPMSAAKAKGENGAARRFCRRPWRCSEPGWRSAKAAQRTRCSRPPRAVA